MEKLPLDMDNIELSEWKKVYEILNSLIESKDFTTNELLDYFRNILDFDRFIILDRCNTPNHFSYSILYALIDYYDEDENIEHIHAKIINDMYHLIIHSMLSNQEIDVVSENNIRLCICICYLMMMEDENENERLEKSSKLYDSLIQNKLCNDYFVFKETVYLFDLLVKNGSIISNIKDSVHIQYFNILWKHLKYDNNVLNFLLDNFDDQSSPDDYSRIIIDDLIDKLCDYYIFRYIEQTKKLLKGNYKHKEKLLSPNELMDSYANYEDLINFIKTKSIPINDDIKNKIMHMACKNSALSVQLKKIKKQFNLKFDDKCMEIYCENKSSGISGFLFLLDEGCNIKFNDFCKYVKTLGGKNTEKVINAVLSKAKKNDFIL
ncbi:hypothetical protein Catovirus_1_314 [Catovirus CTV1]|uniref:Uncharacterized protein n=1 Tax=Catovirus CTV1 TaxID=1977631 RepID=A0A1V0S9A5_9VIRU|nr:hypothetical protein Catovirus_1_314 [Catovirus CTV1]